MIPYKDKEKQREYQKQWFKSHYHGDSKKNRISTVKNHRARYREWYLAYKSECTCLFCGYSSDIEFRHTDRESKIKAVSDIISGGHSIRKLFEEIGKCIPLCKECHLKEHYGDAAEAGGPHRAVNSES